MKKKNKNGAENSGSEEVKFSGDGFVFWVDSGTNIIGSR